jgi:hypothetical protein
MAMAGEDRPLGDKPSGISSFSVGFGTSAAGERRALPPAPPYRLLVAGDFGFAEEGERRSFAGDLAELIETARPGLEVTVGNRLGSLPASVSATIAIRSLADLRPAALLGQFGHHRDAAEALRRGDGALEAAGQRYDRLAAMSSGAGAAPPPDDQGDDLSSLLKTSRRARPEDNTPAGLVASFIAENLTPATGTAAARQAPADAGGLLQEQALAFLSDRRLGQILENWAGLRLLVDTVGKARAIEITVLQVSAGADAEAAGEHLAGDNGAMHEELYDLLLFANRCAATAAGTDLLKALGEAADAFDIVALVTLEPDFARVPPDRLAGMDAPHHTLSGPGFEAFNALRAQAVARRLGIFWNDVLAQEETPDSPALFIPAAWAAAAIALRSAAGSGWPVLGAGNGELSGFPVATHLLRGREVAVATRALLSAESAAGLASAGIATLGGRADRDSVTIARAPLYASFKTNNPQPPTLDDQMVLARISQLLQSVLPAVLGEAGSAEQKAELLQARFADLAGTIPQSPRFNVMAADEGGKPLLDIAVMLPEGLVARNRLEFQIPC